MSHLLLSFVTIGIVWFAWTNFKKVGRLRTVDLALTEDERAALQMRYVMRIVACLLCLAILPFLFTVLTNL